MIVEPLQTALAAEHAAVFGFGALGAQASHQDAPALLALIGLLYEEHRDRRDELTAWIADEGGDPVGSEPTYLAPSPTDTAAQIRAAAIEIERGCADTYGWLVASSTGRPRRWGVTRLTASALRILDLGGDPEPLPGN